MLFLPSYIVYSERRAGGACSYGYFRPSLPSLLPRQQHTDSLAQQTSSSSAPSLFPLLSRTPADVNVSLSRSLTVCVCCDVLKSKYRSRRARRRVILAATGSRNKVCPLALAAGTITHTHTLASAETSRQFYAKAAVTGRNSCPPRNTSSSSSPPVADTIPPRHMILHLRLRLVSSCSYAIICTSARPRITATRYSLM